MRVTFRQRIPLSAAFLVETENAIYRIEYDAAGFGEYVYVNGRLAARAVAWFSWCAPRIEFSLGSVPAALEIELEPWSARRRFRLVIGDEVVYGNGAHSLGSSSVGGGSRFSAQTPGDETAICAADQTRTTHWTQRAGMFRVAARQPKSLIRLVFRVLSGTLSVPVVLGSLRILDRRPDIPPAPMKSLWVLGAGFICILMLAVSLIRLAQGVRWHKAVLEATLSGFFASLIGITVLLLRTTGALGFAYAALAGVIIGLLAATIEHWVETRAGGWY